MKKYISSLLTLLIALPILGVNAATVNAPISAQETNNYLDISKYNPSKLDQSINVRQLLYLYFTIIGDGIPDSYKYIKLEFTNVNPGSSLYKALQK